jgi:hypothetical protein
MGLISTAPVSVSTSPYHFDTGWKTGNHVGSTTTLHEENLIIPTNEDMCYLTFDFFKKTGSNFQAQQVQPSLTQSGVFTSVTRYYPNFFPSEQTYHNMYRRYQGSVYSTSGLNNGYLYRASNGDSRFANNEFGTFTVLPNVASLFSFNTYTNSNALTFYYRVRVITRDLAEGLSA